MTHQEILSAAKQGNPQAIAALMNRALRPQGLTAKVKLMDGCLYVMVESATLPNQATIVPYVNQGIQRLGLVAVQRLIVYGKRLKNEQPDWKQDIRLSSQANSLASNSPQSATEAEPETRLPNHAAPDLSKFALVGQKQPVLSREYTVTSSDKKPSENSTQKNTLAVSEKLVRSVELLKKINLIVLTLFWVEVCFQGLFLLYSLVWGIAREFYTILEIADTTGLFASLIDQLFQFMYEFEHSFELTERLIFRVSFLGLLVWLYSLHTVLKWLFKSYPISPWGAIARYVIPFYNFWGVWNIFSTLANYLIQDRRGPVAHKGHKLQRWLPRLYLTLLLLILANITYYFLVASIGSRSYISWWFHTGSYQMTMRVADK